MISFCAVDFGFLKDSFCIAQTISIKQAMINVLNTSKYKPLFIIELPYPESEKEFRRVMQQVRKQHLHTIIKIKAFDSRVSLFYKVNNLLKISNRFRPITITIVPSDPYLENNLLIV